MHGFTLQLRMMRRRLVGNALVILLLVVTTLFLLLYLSKDLGSKTKHLLVKPSSK